MLNWEFIETQIPDQYFFGHNVYKKRIHIDLWQGKGILTKDFVKFLCNCSEAFFHQQ